MKFLKLDEYAPWRPRHAAKPQQILFPYAEAIQRAILEKIPRQR